MSMRENPLIAGIDEVGRGCIVGPVVAAIVILGHGVQIDGLKDSKKLTPNRRKLLADIIQSKALAWSIGRAEASEIDRINIRQAAMLAMQRAFAAMPQRPDWVRVDGNCYPDLPCPGETIIGGDSKVPEISAASILAKVARDAEMQIYDALYPGYEFVAHKGYPTTHHKTKLRELGPTVVHRYSFAPVSALSPEVLI